MKETVKYWMYVIGYIWDKIDPDLDFRVIEAAVGNTLFMAMVIYYAKAGNKVGCIKALLAALIHCGCEWLVCNATDIYLDEEWKKEGKII